MVNFFHANMTGDRFIPVLAQEGSPSILHGKNLTKDDSPFFMKEENLTFRLLFNGLISFQVKHIMCDFVFYFGGIEVKVLTPS